MMIRMSPPIPMLTFMCSSPSMNHCHPGYPGRANIILCATDSTIAP